MPMRLLIAMLFTLPSFAGSQTQIVVGKGDTLLKIADRLLGHTDRGNPRRYELANQLRKLNPHLKNPNALKPGQTLVISEEKPAATLPTTPAPQPPPPSPYPETKPAPKKQKEIPPSPSYNRFIFIQPRIQKVELISKNKTTGTQSKMKSKSGLELKGQYGWILSNRYSLLFQGGVSQFEFKTKTETLRSLGIGLAIEVSPTLYLDFLAGPSEQFFLQPGLSSEYKLKTILFPALDIKVAWDFYNKRKNIFGISVMSEYLHTLKKNGVEYRSSLQPTGALYWKSNYGSSKTNYQLILAHKQGHHETSAAKKTENLTSVGVGFYFE